MHTLSLTTIVRGEHDTSLLLCEEESEEDAPWVSSDKFYLGQVIHHTSIRLVSIPLPFIPSPHLV
jgi:hypothetical protein